ncbi:MAG: gliding motility-associated C-terminal domain-containing protein [Flavobacteriales bacterium]
MDGLLFYAPNTFTPNNDGLNDIWWPSYTGATAAECRIYDRWGTLIFTSNNLEDAWTGNIRGGDYYAADGIYQYQFIVTDYGGLNHEYQGHILLFR